MLSDQKLSNNTDSRDTVAVVGGHKFSVKQYNDIPIIFHLFRRIRVWERRDGLHREVRRDDGADSGLGRLDTGLQRVLVRLGRRPSKDYIVRSDEILEQILVMERLDIRLHHVPELPSCGRLERRSNKAGHTCQ